MYVLSIQFSIKVNIDGKYEKMIKCILNLYLSMKELK